MDRTPRKRTWECVDQRELTEGRESVLRAWRERGFLDSANEREHIPDGSDGPDMLVDMEPELHASFDSPLATSLASSATSDSIPIRLPAKAINAKSAFPTLGAPGTLKDMTTNVVAERRTGRAR
jgi:hypothetical protein